ncbi:flavin-dependent dehydrogenase [Prosthecobacter fusiformis]|uniref:Flavin-dependent dehydrogenase n=1 Tax=Prosthecobacter fusiformis TaxID=48464 RepID=A0A4R7STX8_9BACT|nr:NAD(P)/FAD-dependent oxidoreductase [Prosthecobacter fusiformis]TDU81757.1 flavin-dependent dehydrogenase [Prosthecobacter fusiformis]
MNDPQMPSVSQADYDVIIMGGAFSGASAALLLKRDHPELRVLVVERQVEFDRKVGESTSEVGGCFLTRVLHLGSYLSAHHYQKHGLRMWFCNSPKDSVEDCTELGPKFQSRLPTFQLDRALLDEHVLKLAREAGADLLRPATLREVTLAEGDENHRVTVAVSKEETKTFTARWVIDASGKAALLSKKLGLHRQLGEEHATSSLWCRYRNVNSLDSHKSRTMNPKLMMRTKASRAAATNHLMGRGWWVWLIPLANGDYSAGIVWDRNVFTLPEGRSLTERLHAHILQHPIGRLMFENAEPVEDDTFYYKGLPYYTEQMAGNRWAMVGDAAGFIDPLYSQGLDYCGHTVFAVTRMIGKQAMGEDITETLNYLKGAYKRSYRLWFESLYKGKYEYMGDAELTRIAFIMDLGTYFVGPVRLVYDNPDYEFGRLPYDGPAGTVFAKFMALYNRRLNAMAKKRQAKGTYGAWNTGMDLTLGQSYTPDFSALRFLRWGTRLWLMAELRTLFGRAPKKMPAMVEMPMEKGAMPTTA